MTREGSKRAVGPAAHLHWLAERQRVFRALFDFGAGKGLEIGPLDTAAVDRQTSDVSYSDVYSRSGIVDKYADDDNVLLELVPETTFPLWDGNRVRSLAEAAAPGAPFDWVVASHVVEHVPNLVGWLADIAQITSPTGALILAVPDRRYTFDVHRPPTTTGEVVEAYLRGDTQPSVRAVYDSVATHLAVDGSYGLNRGVRPPGRGSRTNSPLVALEAARRASDEYIDTHVWTFSAQEFVELIKELRELGISDWYVERLAGTHPPDFEFLTVLRKVSPGADPPAEVTLDSDLPGWLADQWQLRETAQQLSSRLGEALEMLNKLAAIVSEKQ